MNIIIESEDPGFTNVLTLRLCLIIVFLFLPQTSRGDSVKQNWLDVLEHAVQRHDGKLWISNQLSIVVDSKGDGTLMHPAEKEKELVYIDALKKMFSLYLELYKPENKDLYLDVYGRALARKVAERLDFSGAQSDPLKKRVSFSDRIFQPEDILSLYEYINSHMSFVLNEEPIFTRTFMAFSAEDDTKFHKSDGKLYRYGRRAEEQGSVRVNFSEKFSQMCLLATWLVEGNRPLGIARRPFQDPVLRGLLRFMASAKEHDTLHGLQYLFVPIDYLDAAIAQNEPWVMNPRDPRYGLVNRNLTLKASRKLEYEMDGFRVSKAFETGAESELLSLAHFLAEARKGLSSEIPGSVFDAEKGILNWLQEGTNTRDIVNVYLLGDTTHPERNLPDIPDEKVFPESMRVFMRTQFEPVLALNDLWELNQKLKTGGLSQKAATESLQSLQKIWKETVIYQRNTKDSRGVSNLDGMIQEFSYLKAVIDRFEGNQDLVLKSRDPLFSH